MSVVAPSLFDIDGSNADWLLRHWLDIVNKMHMNSISSSSTSYIQVMMIMWMTTNVRASSTRRSTANCEAQLLATNAATSPKPKTPWSI